MFLHIVFPLCLSERRPFPVPGIISATEDPPGCPQLVPCDLPIPQFTCPQAISEDCLYLNIFTPLGANVHMAAYIVASLRVAAESSEASSYIVVCGWIGLRDPACLCFDDFRVLVVPVLNASRSCASYEYC